MHMPGTVPGQREDGVARNTRSSALESRSVRLKLPKRGKPYWVRIDRGLALGYRRIETAGPWIVRKATGDGNSWIKNFAHADDCSSESEAMAASTADRVRQRTCLAMVSARTACRWDRCRRRR